eukprot:gnl/Dysnectes_brevis/1716_a1951_1700.p1 GENE.gnl/Dysnectes_brevis/1716_a1951_1700~~gnl/Dysnectes_brevis/1716_a1951_1700.p1  ORF type:complete len:2427 (+),score=766.19 gnl/Dysnectes_brevis/1716_a1951_1700:3141-10421(+)
MCLKQSQTHYKMARTRHTARKTCGGKVPRKSMHSFGGKIQCHRIKKKAMKMKMKKKPRKRFASLGRSHKIGPPVEIDGDKFVLRSRLNPRRRKHVISSGDWLSLTTDEGTPCLALCKTDVLLPPITPFYSPEHLMCGPVRFQLFKEHEKQEGHTVNRWFPERVVTMPLSSVIAFVNVFLPKGKDVSELEDTGVILSPQAVIEMASSIKSTDIGLVKNSWDKVKGILPPTHRRRLPNKGGTEERPIAKHYLFEEQLSEDIVPPYTFQGASSTHEEYLERVKELRAVLETGDADQLDQAVARIASDYRANYNLPAINATAIPEVAASIGLGAIKAAQDVYLRLILNKNTSVAKHDDVRSRAMQLFGSPSTISSGVLSWAGKVCKHISVKDLRELVAFMKETMMLAGKELAMKNTFSGSSSRSRRTTSSASSAFFGKNSFDKLTQSFFPTVKAALLAGNLPYIREVIDMARESNSTQNEFGKLSKPALATSKTIPTNSEGMARLDFEFSPAMVLKNQYLCGGVTPLHFAAANQENPAMLRTFLSQISKSDLQELERENDNLAMCIACSAGDNPVNFEQLLPFYDLDMTILKSIAATAAGSGNLTILESVLAEIRKLVSTDAGLEDECKLGDAIVRCNTLEDPIPALTVLTAEGGRWTDIRALYCLMHAACSQGKPWASDLGIKMRAPIYIPAESADESAMAVPGTGILTAAIKGRHFAMAAWLVGHGYDLNKDKDYLEPLIVSHCVPFARWLLQRHREAVPGAAELQDKLILVALQSGQREMLSLLLELRGSGTQGAPGVLFDYMSHTMGNFTPKSLENVRMCLEMLKSDPKERVEGKTLLSLFQHLSVELKFPQTPRQRQSFAQRLTAMKPFWNRHVGLITDLLDLLEKHGIHPFGLEPYERDSSLQAPVFVPKTPPRAHLCPLALGTRLPQLLLALRPGNMAALFDAITTERARPYPLDDPQRSEIPCRQDEVIKYAMKLIDSMVSSPMSPQDLWTKEYVQQIVRDLFDTVILPLDIHLEQDQQGLSIHHHIAMKIPQYMSRNTRFESPALRKIFESGLKTLTDILCRCPLTTCITPAHKGEESRNAVTSQDNDGFDAFITAGEGVNPSVARDRDVVDRAIGKYEGYSMFHLLVDQSWHDGFTDGFIQELCNEMEKQEEGSVVRLFNTQDARGNTPFTCPSSYSAGLLKFFHDILSYTDEIDPSMHLDSSDRISIVHCLVKKNLSTALSFASKLRPTHACAILSHPVKEWTGRSVFGHVCATQPSRIHDLSTLYSKFGILDAAYAFGDAHDTRPLALWLSNHSKNAEGQDIPKSMLSKSDIGHVDAVGRSAMSYIFCPITPNTKEDKLTPFLPSELSTRDPAIHTSTMLKRLTKAKKAHDILNHPDRDGRTPLHYASMSGAQVSCLVMLNSGSKDSIDHTDVIGQSAVAYAVRDGHGGVASALLQHGSSPDSLVVNPPSTRVLDLVSPLEKAPVTVFGESLKGESTQGIALLLSLLPSANQRLYAAEAIRNAAHGGTPFIERMIMESEEPDTLNGTIDFPGFSGQQLSHIMFANYNSIQNPIALMSFLRDSAGVDFTTSDAHGWTPLHYLAANSSPQQLITAITAISGVLGAEEVKRQSGCFSNDGHSPLTLQLIGDSIAPFKDITAHSSPVRKRRGRSRGSFSFGSSVSTGIEFPKWFIDNGVSDALFSTPEYMRLDKQESMVTYLLKLHQCGQFLSKCLLALDTDQVTNVLNLPNSEGYTPLLQAMRRENTGLYQLKAIVPPMKTRKATVNTNFVGPDGDTIWHKVIGMSDISVENLALIKLLWGAKACFTPTPDLSIPNRSGRTPLEMAASRAGPISKWIVKHLKLDMPATPSHTLSASPPADAEMDQRTSAAYDEAFDAEHARLSLLPPPELPYLTYEGIPYHVTGSKVVGSASAFSDLKVVRYRISLETSGTSTLTLTTGFCVIGFSRSSRLSRPYWEMNYKDSWDISEVDEAIKGFAKVFKNKFGYDWEKIKTDLVESIKNPIQSCFQLDPRINPDAVPVTTVQKNLLRNAKVVLNRALQCSQRDSRQKEEEKKIALSRWSEFYGIPAWEGTHEELETTISYFLNWCNLQNAADFNPILATRALVLLQELEPLVKRIDTLYERLSSPPAVGTTLTDDARKELMEEITNTVRSVSRGSRAFFRLTPFLAGNAPSSLFTSEQLQALRLPIEKRLAAHRRLKQLVGAVHLRGEMNPIASLASLTGTVLRLCSDDSKSLLSQSACLSSSASIYEVAASPNHGPIDPDALRAPKVLLWISCSDLDALLSSPHGLAEQAMSSAKNSYDMGRGIYSQQGERCGSGWNRSSFLVGIEMYLGNCKTHNATQLSANTTLLKTLPRGACGMDSRHLFIKRSGRVAADTLPCMAYMSGGLEVMVRRPNNMATSIYVSYRPELCRIRYLIATNQ